jgi:pimeloyl-ACP methyl ester carboxylesterase
MKRAEAVGQRLAITIVAIALTAVAEPSQAASPANVPEGPEGSNFWQVPMEAPATAKRGDILWARARSDAPAGSRGWNIVYVSEAADGKLAYVSGEIYVPDAAPTESTRRLLVWNHGTAGLQDGCAPSRQSLYTGPAARRASRVPAIVDLLKRGYVIVASDYQGLGVPGPAAYLNGPAQGKASLDSARAARNFPEARVGDRVGLYGFSQGGQTDLWAAHLAPSYAPELKLLGIAPIAPASRHLELSFYDLGIPPNAGYFVTRFAGLAVGHPEVQLRDVLLPAGLELLATQTWGCFETFSEAVKLKEPYARREALEPGTPWRKLLEANDAFLPIPATTPILLFQGDKDIDVPVDLTQKVRADLCAQGSVVEYREFAGAGHLETRVEAEPFLGDWFDARFRGDRPMNQCRP